MKYFIMIILLMLMSCTQESTLVTDAELSQDFTLNVGERKRIGTEGLSVKFNGVMEDSRCPIGAVCVWQGNGAISLEFQKSGMSPLTAILHTTLNPKDTTYAGYEIRFKRLSPYPKLGIQILPSEYKATLNIKKI